MKEKKEKENNGGFMEENKMGVLPVKKLIVSMAVPMMISMLVQALYNIVDSIFVSKVAEEALTGVTLAFPLQMLMISVGSGMGVGMNAILSRALGEKKQDRANAAANTGLFLTVMSYIVFLIIGIFVSRPFINSQTNKAVISDYGTTYITICTTLSLGLFFQMTFERLLQSTGKTIFSMVSQLTGAIVNIILDPILIFGLLGMPKLGVAGAAYATVAGQTVAGIVGYFLNVNFNKEVQLSIKEILKPDVSDIIKIYEIGIPSMIMMSIGSVMTYLMNNILKTFSDTAQAVFGAYFKLQSFFFMPVFGLNNGLIPVLAFNYGAKSKQRIKESVLFSMKMAFCVMIFGTAVFWSIPKILLGFFDASDYMLKIGAPALRIISLSFPIASICIILGSMFQAFAKSTYSLIVSISRQLIALIPAAWLLSKTGNVNNVWWAFPIAEVASLTASLYFYNRVKKNIIDKL